MPNRVRRLAAFDSVLTESGTFPMLHRDSVVFSIQESNFAGLERLREDKFPRLVESENSLGVVNHSYDGVKLNILDEVRKGARDKRETVEYVMHMVCGSY
jgi:hypothetical protein